MRFEHIARELYAKPWAIMPETYSVFHDVFQAHIEGRIANIMGRDVEYAVPQEYQIIEGVAVIQIDGALGHRLPEMSKACMGFVDYLDIRAAIWKANADQAVDAILLNINSPGGAVTGLHETAEYIQKSEKFVVGYTDSMAASAGYYLMAACHTKACTGSALVGSIGALMTWLDVSRQMEAMGIDREMISSGKFKGMGYPGVPLTEEQRELLQDHVDMLAEEFKQFVRKNSNVTDEEVMEGQTFTGKQAVQVGLVEINANFEEAIYHAKEN